MGSFIPPRLVAGDLPFQAFFGAAYRSPAERARVDMDLRDYPGVDPKGNNSSLAAFRTLFSQIPAEGANIHVPGGMQSTYAFEDQITAPANRGNIRIFGGQPVLDLTNFPKGSNNALFAFTGTVTGMADAIPVVENVSRFSRFVTVASGKAASIPLGVPIMLCSTQTHIGIPEQGGYGLYRAGQWVYPRKRSGDTIELDDFPVDSYPVDTGETVVLRPATLLERIELDGLRFRGPGRGNDYPDASVVPPEVMPFDIRYAWDVKIKDCRFRDFAKFAGYVGRSYGVTIDTCGYVGRDLRTASNQGSSQSDRFTGVYIVSCSHTLVHACVGEGLRRLFDTGSNGTGTDLAPVGRYTLVYGSTSRRSYGGLGSHAGDRVTYYGCHVEMASNGGIGLRATNGRVLLCTFLGIGTATSQAGVTRIGGAFNLDYPETARSGDFEFSYNYVDGAYTVLEITGDFNRGLARNNTLKNIRGHAVSIQSKKWDSFEFDGGLIDLSGRGTAQSCGVYQQYQAGKGIAPGSIKVRATIENAWRGVVIGGGDQTTPTGPVDLDIAFRNCEDSNIHTGDPFEGADGYIGEHFNYGKCKSYTNPINGFRTGRIGRFSAEPTLQGIEGPGFHDTVVRYVTADPTVTLPTAGTTWQVGQRLRRHPPADGLPNEWITVTAGTISGSTWLGSMAAGSPTLTLATAYTLPLQSWVTVPGAGASGAALRAQVIGISVDGLTVTLDRNASLAVSAVSVTDARPTYRPCSYAGLGNAAGRNVGTGAGTVAAGDDSRITAAARVLGADATPVTLTGTTNEVVLATIVIPGGSMGPKGQLRATVQWAPGSGLNARTLRVRLGGLSGAVHHMRSNSSSTVIFERGQVQIANRGSETSQVGSANAVTAFNTAGSAAYVSNIDTTVDQQLVITGQLAVATESMTLDSYSVELLRPAA